MRIAIFGIVMFVATGLVYALEEGYFSPIVAKQEAPLALLLVNTTPLKIEVARTPFERRTGLSNREMLPQDTGLWFVFDTPDTHGIWMKDMKFAIDIVWVDSTLTIVHIEEDVAPESYPKVFEPPTMATYVLEVNRGVASALGMKVGDTLRYMEFAAEDE